MQDRLDFEDNTKVRASQAACADWGTLLPDAAEDLLGEPEARALELHLLACAGCRAEFAEARRGAAWLTLLKEHTPEPTRDLVAGILARTSGADSAAASVSPEIVPFASGIGAASGAPRATLSPWLPTSGVAGEPGQLRWRVRRWLGLDHGYAPALQPRLAMTAAMAFLSICLTLNLLGVSVTQLHAQDLQTTRLQRTVEGRGETLLRSYHGLRLAYRMESRLSGWLMADAGQDSGRVRQ